MVDGLFACGNGGHSTIWYLERETYEGIDSIAACSCGPVVTSPVASAAVGCGQLMKSYQTYVSAALSSAAHSGPLMVIAPPRICSFMSESTYVLPSARIFNAP